MKESRKRKLRIGHLYGKLRKDNDKNGDGDGDGNGDELAFRQSSFTVGSCVQLYEQHAQKDPQSQIQSTVEDYWTMQ